MDGLAEKQLDLTLNHLNCSLAFATGASFPDEIFELGPVVAHFIALWSALLGSIMLTCLVMYIIVDLSGVLGPDEEIPYPTAASFIVGVLGAAATLIPAAVVAKVSADYSGIKYTGAWVYYVVMFTCGVLRLGIPGRHPGLVVAEYEERMMVRGADWQEQEDTGDAKKVKGGNHDNCILSWMVTAACESVLCVLHALDCLVFRCFYLDSSS
jgi:hypothetical protein